MAHKVTLVSPSLLTEAIIYGVDAGKRRLMRDLVICIDGETMVFPEGEITDYSSWPSLLPSPGWQKMDVAGVAHDYFYRYGRTGRNGRKIGYNEANYLWMVIARAGQSRKNRLSGFWAAIGYTGLQLGGWIKWLQYRKMRRE